MRASSEYTSLYEDFGGTRPRPSLDSRLLQSVQLPVVASTMNEINYPDSHVGSNPDRTAAHGTYSIQEQGYSTKDLKSVDSHSRGTTPSMRREDSSIDSECLTASCKPGQGMANDQVEDGRSTLRDHPGGIQDVHPPAGQRNVSVLKASFLLLKAFVGTGVLFLPKAFSNGGILFSCLMLVFVAWICSIAFLMLIQVRLQIPASFQDIGLVLFGPWMRTLVLLSVAISQLGFVCAYLIFISQNLRAVVLSISQCRFDAIAERVYILIPLVVLIPLVLIRQMSVLSVPSMIANVFIAFGLVCLWTDSIHNLTSPVRGPGPDVNWWLNKDEFALLIGTAVFAYEGIGLIIPITESMREPEKFPRVLAITMTIVTLIFGSVGALGYASYGSQVQTIVLLNLPIQSSWTLAVEILYPLAIILSIPLMLSPVSRIVENAFFGERGSEAEEQDLDAQNQHDHGSREASGVSRSGSAWPRNRSQGFLCGSSWMHKKSRVRLLQHLLRIGLICSCAAISFLVGAANLDKFVSLMGSVACIPLCFIFPSLFHYRACAKTRRAKVVDCLLFVFGVLAMVFTIFITIRSWITPQSSSEINRCPRG